MRRDKLLEEQLVRLDALYEYAKMHGENDQTESIKRSRRYTSGGPEAVVEEPGLFEA